MSGDPNDPEKGPGIIYHWTDSEDSSVKMNSFVWRLKININGQSSLATQVERVNPFAQEPQASVSLPLPTPPQALDNRPKFVYKVRSMDNPSNRQIFMTKTPKYLIFNVVMESGWGTLDTKLDAALEASGEAALMKSYFGHGAYMLSNVRFNQLISFHKTDGVNTHIVINLISRRVTTDSSTPGVYIYRYEDEYRRVSYNSKVEEKYNDR
ncbi:hypothetical protein BGW36DRAFT_360574 [Talaromyces proteolyticus]|uniref:Uncharacterized protein n=1 Tax=Talaromyces proteolyticus TaxID=1131652 RepID=A0AAD4KUE0_9EURO|nr:uncharacterized protein BGW36DRAFT_360574 [Talaromyces proteolyticus]KAH8696761.1 hypothetical protein BGW36DRAFT_360574 [Talaromyces proteolyticus]